MKNPLFWSKPSLGKRFQVDTGWTLTTGLVSYYKMEDSTDFWSTRNLTWNNISFVSGKVNNCASLNGSNSFFSWSHWLWTWNITFSVSYWVYVTWSQWAYATNFVIWNQDVTNQAMIFSIRQKSWWNDALFLDYPNVSWWSTETRLTYNAWNLIIIKKSWDTYTVKINNNTAETLTLSWLNVSNSNLLFWEVYWVLFFNWKIDECWFWSKVLSTQEDTDLYNSWNWQTMIS